MSDTPLLDDPVLRRVHDARPFMSDDTLSPAGAEAQRILARVLAPTPTPAPAPALLPRRRRRWRRRRLELLPRRRFAAFAGVMAVAAALTVGLLVAGGGDSSIIAQAYAATSPQGVVVHYLERSDTVSPAGKRSRTTTNEYWLSGQRSRIALLAADGSISQDIVTRPGQLENLSEVNRQTLLVMPLPSRACTPADTLEGYCEDGQTPIAGLRTMLHSGALRVSGQTTLAGQRVAIVTGRSGSLTIRALISTRTSLPITVTLTEVLPPYGAQAYVTHSTITGYERLALTPGTRRLLNLPAHPHARIIRFRACPTTAQPRKLCNVAH